MTPLELFLEDPYTFLKTANINTLLDIIKLADTKYYNNYEPIMTDEQYDMIIDKISRLDPSNEYFKKVGAPLDELTQKTKNKIILPYTMGSMNKIKPENVDIINNFKSKYSGPWLISDKLDGISALLVIDPIKKQNNLYTRGNGTIGTDITNLLDVINIKIPSNLKTPIVIRGELIMSKEKFKKYASTMANARNMVAGIVNSKTISISKAKDVDFIGYELVEPWIPYTEQFDLLAKYKIKTVYFTQTSDLSVDNLSKILKDRKTNSNYECDGIIITYNSPNQRVPIGNPDYAFAFKNLAELETAIVTVKEVEWNVSKDGYLKPTLILEPTNLSGVTIKRVTAFNAKYIVDNSIGTGTKIKLVRSGDVIPHILEVVKKSKKPDLPLDPSTYEWNETNVDIILIDASVEQKIKELAFFCSKLDMKNIGEAVVSKMIEADIDSIPKILSVTKSDLEQVENFKGKMVEKIYETISSKSTQMTLLEFMSASNTFGHGMGERKIKKILEVYPDIIYLYIEKQPNILVDMIKKLDGFDTITATQFITKMPLFLDLLNKIPLSIQERILLEIPQVITSPDTSKQIFSGLKIVFSGFRNKDWEKIIESKGGEILSSVSKNTSILVSTQEDINTKTNAKVKKAFDLGIKVLSKEQFENKYITSKK
jgi:NAD-dependent DNA ligase